VYAPFGAIAEGTEGGVQFPVSVAGTLGTLAVKMQSAPGNGGSDFYTFNVRKNGATAISCTITGTTATTCTNLVNTTTVVVGDLLALQVVPGSGGSTPNNEPAISWSVRVTP
jgi:hypothetical protein